MVNGTPEQLTLDAEESVRRLGIECFDLLMLHSVDPNVPLERSMITMCELHRRGLCHAIGICNVHAAELSEAQHIAELESLRLHAIQCPLNLIQQDSQRELIPHAKQKGIQAHVYWTLMKGLLAGKIHRTHQFAEGDSRPNYDIFQGQQRENAHRIVDELVRLAQKLDSTPAALAVGWTLSQPGVEHALVGARKVEQVIEIAEAQPLETSTLEEINRITREVLN